MGRTPSSRRLGLSHQQIVSLNDDRIGRCLDRLFQNDCGSLALTVATHAIREFAVALEELHNDSTTITFHGEYADKEEKRKDQTRLAITWGHNKDHRPDLKQLLFILTISKDGGVPVYFQAKSGNTADDLTHRDTWDLLCTLAGRRDFLYVADCKLASAENMAYVAERDGRFVTLIPRTRSEDRAFRESLTQGQVQWQPVHEKCDEKGEIVDRFSVSKPAPQCGGVSPGVVSQYAQGRERCRGAGAASGSCLAGTGRAATEAERSTDPVSRAGEGRSGGGGDPRGSWGDTGVVVAIADQEQEILSPRGAGAAKSKDEISREVYTR